MNLPEIEKFLQQNIFPDLENGRPNFDKPHTIAVVRKVKDIVFHNPKIKVDHIVLIIAAYSHDWGYAGFFKSGIITDYEKIKDVKAEHMIIGAQKITQLLDNPIFKNLSQKQKKRIIHLVSIHDKFDILKDIDELLLMEADTLGGLDLEFVRPTFDKNSNEKWMSGPLQHRLSKFITNHSKEEAQRLIKLRQEYYSNLD